MDPWIVLGWVAVVCVSVILIMVTGGVLVSVIRSLRQKPKPPVAVADRLTATDRQRIRESDGRTVPILRDITGHHE